MTVTILLADDQALVRAGFRMILGAEDDLRVVGEAEDEDEAIRLARSLQPDVVLMDIQMPRVDGIEATRQIVAKSSTYTRVVILTTFERDDYIFEAQRQRVPSRPPAVGLGAPWVGSGQYLADQPVSIPAAASAATSLPARPPCTPHESGGMSK